jgi:hypothetical protein
MLLSLFFVALLVTAVVEITRGRTKSLRDTNEIGRFQTNLWKRYLGGTAAFVARDDDGVVDDAKRTQADRLIAHMDRIIDRQINKARGILPFNSILLALLVFERSHLSPVATPLYLAAISGLVISSCICLWRMFLVEYAGNQSYMSFSNEFEISVSLAVRRAIEIDWATTISFASLISGVLAIVMSEAHSALTQAVVL